MKKLKKKFGSVWGPTLAICIAIVVSSAVTATAATVINGKNIKNKTVAGTKLKNNTITGTQVKESKLGRVPLATRADLANQADNAANAANAAKVGGVSLGSLIQGNGNIYSGSKSAGVSTGNNTILDIPGVGTFRFDCAANGLDATPEFLNTSGDTFAIVGSTQYRDGGGDLYKIDPNDPNLNNNTFWPFTSRQVGNGTFQIWNYAGGGTSVTVNYSSIFCSFNAQAVVTK